jgi:hypothetical protein
VPFCLVKFDEGEHSVPARAPGVRHLERGPEPGIVSLVPVEQHQLSVGGPAFFRWVPALQIYHDSDLKDTLHSGHPRYSEGFADSVIQLDAVTVRVGVTGPLQLVAQNQIDLFRAECGMGQPDPGSGPQ